METPAPVALDDLLPPRPTPPSNEVLGLDDVRARVICYATRMGGGVWVLTSVQRFERSHELVGVYEDAADALRDLDDEIATECLSAHDAVTADEVHEAAWEITAGTVVLRLAWDSIVPRQQAQR
ncbi:hypothetical protein [Streptomyces sp. 6N223]|uniref:hypothetical protein n=1 Tax=Streptomyces sp. 6N223 TaxID=3457412 RepID=UPI003FD34CEB